MYRKAVELAEANGWFLARQFETEANARIHENTTAREILADFDGERLDYWVTGYGTGGTVTGVGRVLRKRTAGNEDRPVRTRQRAASGSGHARRDTPRIAGRRATPPSSRIRSRAGPPTSSRMSCRKRWTTGL